MRWAATLTALVLAGAAAGATERPQPRPDLPVRAEQGLDRGNDDAALLVREQGAALSFAMPNLEAWQHSYPRRAPSRAAPLVPLPRPRPALAQDQAASNPAPRVQEASFRSRVAVSPRPPERPENLRRRATVAASGMRIAPLAPLPAIPGTGFVCGDPAIRGAPLRAIAGRVAGCGIDAPVEVTEVGGIRLSQPAMLDCPTARALADWVERGARPAVGRLGGGLVQLDVAAHYVCRSRNNASGATLSEHAQGRAIDISALVLRNGTRLTVLRGWRDPQHAALFRALHDAACGPFGTVLGPDADRHHQDHFHFDTARHRHGSYCR